MQPVTLQPPATESKQVAQWGHTGDTFSVIFRSNPKVRYDYFAVPREVADKVMGAESPGSALNEFIKREGYDFARVDLGDGS